MSIPAALFEVDPQCGLRGLYHKAKGIIEKEQWRDEKGEAIVPTDVLTSPSYSCSIREDSHKQWKKTKSVTNNYRR